MSETKSVDTVDFLPKCVLERLESLMALKKARHQIEGLQMMDIYKVFHSYQTEYEPLNKQRREIVLGINDEIPNQVKGIPGFWIRVLKNNKIISKRISERDELVLSNLIDIRVFRSIDSIIFTLEFEFEPNFYFTNKVLVKEFSLGLDPENPNILSPINCSATYIDWSDGTNYLKRGKAKKTNFTEIRFHKNSFFQFFDGFEVRRNCGKSDDLLIEDWKLADELGLCVENAIDWYHGNKYDESEDESGSENGSDSEDQSDSEDGSDSEQSIGDLIDQ